MNRDKKKEIRSVDLMIAAQISLLIGILFLGSFFYFRRSLLFSISLVCLTLVAPSLAILSYASTLGLQNSKKRRSSITFICVLSIPLLIWIVSVIKFTLPYLYTPPAITMENYKFYSRCVAFVKSQNEHENISVTWRGYYTKDGAYFSTIDSNSVDIKNNFSEEEISEILLLSKQMKKFGCLRLQKDNDVILFYKRRNRILPTRPGVAFSINGINLNDANSAIVNEYKPFLKIDNEWYVSKQLVYGGLMRTTKKSLPKSLIDHSMRTEWVNHEIK